MIVAISTTNKIWLAAFAGAFIAFALIASMVVPRWRPDFPGERGRGWFILATLALVAAMLFAVEVFAVEEETAARGHEAGEVVEETPGGGEPRPEETTAGAPEGDPAAGRELYTANGCGNCHAFAAAGASSQVGPNLDESLQGKDADYVRTAIVDPNAEIAEGYQPGVMPQTYGDQLSAKQVLDLVAFLTQD